MEEDTKFVPVTVRMNALPPANAKLGFKETVMGTGLLAVKVKAPDVPPPGAEFTAVTIAVPAVAMSAAVIAACKLVLEAKVVVRGLPFH